MPKDTARSLDRRSFVGGLAVSAASLAGCGTTGPEPDSADATAQTTDVPSYLKGYEDLFARDPRQASLAWFRDAKYGLFLHYGVYSILSHGEWVQLRETIPVAEYAKLKDRFTADKFDADFITDLALESGMKYVNITSAHHDSFCLFKTNTTDWSSMNSPARRDLIGELAEACARKGLGFFTYYSYGLDWKHPYFYSLEASQVGEVKWNSARPAYKDPQPEYKFEKDEDFRKYIDFKHEQLRELLTQYKDLAGIWLDPIMGYYSRPDLFPIEETYSLIRSLSPKALICFKQGANGDEDYVAPEREPRAHQNGGEVGRIAWERNQGKPIEICDTMQPRVWGVDVRNEGDHKKPEQVLEMLEHARKVDANLLLNTGPLADGSIHAADDKSLRAAGQQLRQG